MNVMDVKEFLNQSMEIVVYFARTELFPAPQNKQTQIVANNKPLTSRQAYRHFSKGNKQEKLNEGCWPVQIFTHR